MTLIAGGYDGTDCVLVSDILLSSRHRPVAPPILPMTIPRHIVHSTSEQPHFHIVSTCRKVTLVSPTLAVAWAGQVIVGTSITKGLIDTFGVRDFIPTAEVGSVIKNMAGALSKDEYQDLQIMVFNLERKPEGGFSTWIWSGGCDQLSYHDTDLMLGGSGRGHFVGDLYGVMDSVNPFDGRQFSFKQALFTSLHYVQSKQLDVGDAYKHLYGGWFKIIVLRYLDGSFCLAPLSNVAVVNWAPIIKDNEVIVHIKDTYFQTYIEDVLVILHSEWNGTGFGLTDVHRIPPCTDRERNVDSKILNINLKSDSIVFYLSVPAADGLRKLIMPIVGSSGTFCTWNGSRISIKVDDEIKKAVESAFESCFST